MHCEVYKMSGKNYTIPTIEEINKALKREGQPDRYVDEVSPRVQIDEATICILRVRIRDQPERITQRFHELYGPGDWNNMVYCIEDAITLRIDW